MKILLATDGSEYSEGAARFLTRLNFSPKDEIIVLHVVSEIPYEDDYRAKIKLLIKKVAPEILSSSVNILKPVKAKVSAVEEDGYPDTTIIDVAAKADIDLIVMGARGIKGIKSFLLGSVTRSVAINSPKPVLVIKPPQWEISEKIKLFFATDSSDSANATARFLSSVPFPGDTELIILHVAWSPVSDIPERFAIEIGDRIKEEVAKARTVEYAESEKIIEQARAYLSERFTKINGITKIGDPSIEILHEAEVFKADIIVVGSRGLRGIKGMMGSVSRRILGHSDCSVLIGKTIGEYRI